MPKKHDLLCTCDQFDLITCSSNGNLSITLVTDLPLNVRVKLTVQRIFVTEDSGEWIWTAFEKILPIQPQADSANGFTNMLTNDELDTKGLNMYRHLKGQMHIDIATPPSSTLTVIADAPTMQHKFGLCNRGLTGLAVSVHKHAHLLERTSTVEIAVSPKVLKQLGF